MIQFDGVGKKLDKFQLKDITFTLPAGYIMGLIGENGAGKSTILNMILGLYSIGKGDIFIFGETYAKQEKMIKNQIGFVLVEELFNPYLTLVENGDLYGKYYESYDREILVDYLKRFSLNPNGKGKALSKGEKLKFQFAFALAHKPKLLVLDEPTANFDPEFREQFFHILTEFVSDGEHSVILATHLTTDLDRLADYILFVHKGQQLFYMDKETMQDSYRIVQGENYKFNLMKEESIIYKEQGELGTKALVHHHKRAMYDKEVQVRIPTIEEIMYFTLKGEEQKGRTKRW